MKRLHTYLSALLLVSVLACVSENKEEGSTEAIPTIISLAKGYAGDSLDFENLVEAPSVVVLQYDGVIAEVDKVLLTETYLYVQDKKSVVLLQFDPRGKFIRQIGAKGQGPGEYTSVNDFAVDSLTRHVFMLSLEKMALLEFSEDGKMIREQKMPFFAFALRLLPDGFLFFLNSNANELSGTHELIATDRNLKITEKMLGYFDTPDYASQSGSMFGGPNGVLTALTMSDTIYSVSAAGNATTAKYVLDFSPKVLPDEYRIAFSKFVQHSLDYDVKTGPYFETRNWFVFNHIDDRRLETSFYHRPSGRLFDSGKNFERDSRILLSVLAMYTIGTDQDRFIASFSPEYLKSKFLDESMSELLQNLRKQEPEKHKFLFFTLKAP